MSTPRPSRSTFQRTLGLAVAAVGTALVVRGGLGLGPWNVLADGVALGLGVPFGIALVVVGCLVLAADAAAGVRLQARTVVELVAFAGLTELLLRLVPEPGPRDIEIRCALLLLGVVALGVGRALHTSGGLQPGRASVERLAVLTGRPDRDVQIALGSAALLAGGMLGGIVNLGSVAAVLAVGPIARRSAPWLAIARRAQAKAETPEPHHVGSRAWPESDRPLRWSPSSPSSPSSSTAASASPVATLSSGRPTPRR